ncbi:hypothetical protein EVAR_21243_1 [Eumeta japonica]|uniref:Uncharacterized protein n=1 Tax=Eumeta variegata TaxID=151549 RepID=A0A4C1Z384_EUMVA|nr:hypothetical protein EVAR_21243_1 [Eumeta japonica]
MRATRQYDVPAAHGQMQLQTSHYFVVDLLDRSKISGGGEWSEGEGSRLKEKEKKGDNGYIIDITVTVTATVQRTKVCCCEVCNENVAIAYNWNAGDKKQGSGCVEPALCIVRRQSKESEFRALYCTATDCVSHHADGVFAKNAGSHITAV